ncbi:hypothetical protein OUZ56_032764 [Daphnia magna]|uniref:Uncharacterized protein n=1 Tax=Daphnia magna TaxID=35525 RepID=A0ABQ9ZXB7_9CRUS|nr:hypothetical protein OUZ56_032764 [Daphnia magna]
MFIPALENVMLYSGTKLTLSESAAPCGNLMQYNAISLDLRFVLTSAWFSTFRGSEIQNLVREKKRRKPGVDRLHNLSLIMHILRLIKLQCKDSRSVM